MDRWVRHQRQTEFGLRLVQMAQDRPGPRAQFAPAHSGGFARNADCHTVLASESALLTSLLFKAFLFVMRSFIGHNHVLNQAVAHDILLAEEGEVDPLDAMENTLRFLRPERVPVGKSTCVTSPVMTAFDP